MSLIPQEIHFVWIGGPIPEKYLLSIQELAQIAKKSGFKVTIWVDDEKNYYKSLENMRQKKYSKLDYLDLNRAKKIEQEEKNSGIQVRKINELLDNMTTHPFYQKDNRLRDFIYIIGREAIGLKNEAALVDLLRCEILRQFGGYYFDTDTKFILDSKSLLIADDAPLGIKANFSVIGEKENLTIHGSNDIIAAIPSHPALENIILYILDQYKELDQTNELAKWNKKKKSLSEAKKNYLDDFDYLIHDETTAMDAKRFPYLTNYSFLHSRRREYTIEASGPVAFIAGLKQFLETLKDDENFHSIDFRYGHCGDRWAANVHVVPQFDNTWLKTNKPTSMKGLSFSDTSIKNTLFARKRKKTISKKNHEDNKKKVI